MRIPLVALFMGPLLAAGQWTAYGESIDGRVVQIQLPAEDLTLYYIEARAGFTVKLAAKTAFVEAPRMYIGDGTIAVELYADPIHGIRLQKTDLDQGDQFKQDSRIQVQPGYRRAVDLKPGDIYVTLPGIIFDLPPK
jgi:hypothetical protein